jgi:integrase
MPIGHSTTAAGSRKPAKPHKDFPLFAHNNGQWAKKVRQKIHFFGVWADHKSALKKWLAEKDDLLDGRVPRSRLDANAASLKDLCNQFLTTKKSMFDTGELSVHSFTDYHRVCETLVETFGGERLLTDLRPDDFELLRTNWAKTWGPVRLGGEINRVRIVFNYAFKNGLIDRPIRYGEGFNRPSKKTLRLARAEKGVCMFEAAELRKMIGAASQPLKAMLLLAINSGLGNSDIGQMALTAVDLKMKWLDYPRPKTGVQRRCPLWPETIKAIAEWLKKRPGPSDADDARLLFLTVRGAAWHKTKLVCDENGRPKRLNDQPITHECRKLLDRLKIKGNRNFYAIRHTFETIGGESLDQVAVNAIMGHDDGSMASNYRERVTDERLQRVVEHVRAWLFRVTV